MAYKLKKVYICDHCNKVALPDIWISPSENYKIRPSEWGSLGKEDLCPECYHAYIYFKNYIQNERKK